jgi:hypothetical protein
MENNGTVKIYNTVISGMTMASKRSGCRGTSGSINYWFSLIPKGIK